MTKLRSGIFAATIAVCFLATTAAVQADDKYYTRAFDATVAVDNGKAGVVTSRTISDGKGHQRIESKTAMGSTVSIMDYNKKKMATIMEKNKMVVLSPLNPSAEPTETQKLNPKELGNQTINGHPCKGQSYKIGPSTYEVWTGTDINYPVKSTIVGPTGKTVTELKNFSNTPGAVSFDVPTTGYKVIGQ